ncbi:cytidylyltransferase domain-containing protein [Bradyrhizobium sp. sBnM-33]|uniref:cytidylyltransferase domain-containing protein n=1 Tax=Bradyrhizobium sp. sBnM-33 TaxID=2831780 RepID=UPI00289B61F5|nr:hypothetical protein [Bradyrhizobium sp. sBnM-33]
MIIPSRLRSIRLPGMALADIKGRPMIVQVSRSIGGRCTDRRLHCSNGAVRCG